MRTQRISVLSWALIVFWMLLALTVVFAARAQTTPAWAYPSTTQTGVPAVDAAISAMLSQDASALRAQFAAAPHA